MPTFAKRLTIVALVLVAFLGAVVQSAGQPSASAEHADIRLFFQAAQEDEDLSEAALEQIAAAGWRDGYAAIIRDMMRLMQPPQRPERTPGVPRLFPGNTDPAFELTLRRAHPSTKIWRRLMEFVEDQTGERFDDLEELEEWIWEQPYELHPDYALFKGAWYAAVDQRFRDFFPADVEATIRLDEIDWGGVTIDGIPELEYPKTIPADDADYLDADHIVFGIAVNGEARAYPKRILAWHEMAIDRLGGVELTIVYCTLCGTVIPYESVVDGKHITIGTSGFLYRSNKLMFDEETKSLWNTFEGTPVVGPLVGSGVRLTHRSVVTTTWEEWRRKHPGTTVLSLETGYERDYREGAAYRQYFSNDRLMFQVPQTDDRLRNKDEVVVMLLEDAAGVRQPLALSAEFLEDNQLYQMDHAGHPLVIVTTDEGANRVYASEGLLFARRVDNDRVTDTTGETWTVTEDGLVTESDPALRLARVAAQRAFWFGWYSQFPETVLVK